MCSIFHVRLNCFVRQSYQKGAKRWKREEKERKSLHFTTFFSQLKQEKTWISDRYLKTYCYAAHYIYTLLADGYKFDKDNWNQIYFTKEVSFRSRILWNLISWSEKAETHERIHQNVDGNGATHSNPFQMDNNLLSKRCGLSGMPWKDWAYLIIGPPQQKGDSWSVTHPGAITKSHTLRPYFPNCIATNAQMALSFSSQF